MGQIIWLARHGNRLDFVDPEWFKTASRPFDPPLSPDGVQQAQSLARRLRDEGITRVFASPFLRAVETAHHVADLLDLSIGVESGFSEWLNPDWFPDPPVCLPLDSLARRFPRVDASYRSRVMARYPETSEVALARAGKAARLLSDEFRGNLLIVGHGASVVGASWGLLRNSPELHTAFCSLVKLRREADAWTLDLRGDTSHLEETESVLRFH